MEDTCKIPLGTAIATSGAGNKGRAVVGYLASHGVTNDEGYCGTGNGNIGRTIHDRIRYADNMNDFTTTITWEEFVRLTAEPESEDNYLTFN